MTTRTHGAGLALAHVLDLALSMEGTAERFYSEAAAKLADPTVQRLLEGMAATERAHAETWQHERDALRRTPASVSNDPDGVVSAYLATWLQVPLTKAQEGLPRLDPSASPAEVLSAALRMETEAIAFYSTLADFVDDQSTRQQVRRVLADELAHATDVMASMRRYSHP